LQGFGLWVSGLAKREQDRAAGGPCVEVSGFVVSDVGFRVGGFGFRVYSCGVSNGLEGLFKGSSEGTQLVGLTDYSQVDNLGVWSTSVNCEVKRDQDDESDLRDIETLRRVFWP